MSGKTTRFTVRLDRGLDIRLDREANRQGISKNQLVSNALKFYMDVQEGELIYHSFGEERMNQIIELIIGLKEALDIQSMEFQDFVSTMVRLTSGDNYLSD